MRNSQGFDFAEVSECSHTPARLKKGVLGQVVGMPGIPDPGTDKAMDAVVILVV